MTLLDCIPVNRISLGGVECETEALSFWESSGVRTLVYYASAKKQPKHVILEGLSPLG